MVPPELHPDVVRGRSAARVRDGLFTLAITAVVVVLLGLTVVVGWMDGRSFLLSLSVVGFGFVIGAFLLVAAQHAWCCRACGVGLEDDAFVRVAPDALPHVRGAVEQADAAAVDAAVRSHPHAGGPGTDLDLAYCPRCCTVAVARLERPRGQASWPGPTVLTGPGVAPLVAIADVRTSG
jgi:hypothetical protein